MSSAAALFCSSRLARLALVNIVKMSASSPAARAA